MEKHRRFSAQIKTEAVPMVIGALEFDRLVWR
jgi:hypothetical protein